MTVQNNLTPNKSQNEKSRGFFYGYVILAAAFIILVIAGGAVTSFGVFLKPMLTEFGWSRAAISSANSLNLILSGLVGILAGRISDRFNPKLALTIAGLFFGLGYLLMSQVHNIWQIYLFYGVLISFGGGFIAIPLLSLVARWFVKGRGLASGIIMSGVGLGIVIIPPLANMVISNYNWRTSFIVLGIACLVPFIALAQLLKRAPGQTTSKDTVKAAEPLNHDLQSPSHSLREALGSMKFWTIMIMGFFFFFGAQTIMVHIVAHATDIGYSSTVAATILSVIGFIIIFSTVGGGLLGDRIGNRNSMVVVFILMSLAFIGFRLSAQLWVLYLCAVVFGLGYGGFSALQSPLMADFFGLKDLGVILSSFMFAQNIGGALGSVIAGSIFDISGNYQWAFLLCAVLSVASLVFSILLKPPQRKFRV